MKTETVTNAQRALWMVLLTSLAAPFFAGLLDVALTLAAPAFDFALPPRLQKTVGDVALGAFAWSAFPATLAAVGLSPFVLQSGSYGWLHAAVAGVVAFTAAVILFPFDHGGSLPYLAFFAGLVAIGMRSLLISAGILKA